MYREAWIGEGRDQPAARGPDPGLGELRGLADPTATPNAAGLTSGFDMSPGVARPLWPGRAIRVRQTPRALGVFMLSCPSLGGTVASREASQPPRR